MPASDVLPSPGGPANSRWSAGWSRFERGLDDDPQVLGQLALADELGQGAGPQPGLVGLLGRAATGSTGRDRRRRSTARPARRRAAGQHLLAGLGRHRLRASSRRAVRTSSSTGASSSTASRAPAISSGP